MQALHEPMLIVGQRVHIGASVGIALSSEHTEDASALLHCADLAMYAAKRSGSVSRLHNKLKRLAN